jgi:hypothetical protein
MQGSCLSRAMIAAASITIPSPGVDRQPLFLVRYLFRGEHLVQPP